MPLYRHRARLCTDYLYADTAMPVLLAYGDGNTHGNLFREALSER